MKKLLPFIFFLSTIMSYGPISGKSKKPETDIEKIENQYSALLKNSPSVKARGKEIAKEIRFIQPEDKMIGDYSKLHQIALVRHGEPDMKLDGKYTSEEANAYLQCYDTVCIIVPEKPFFNIGKNEDVKVFSSPINRALTTAQYIFGTSKEFTVSPVFREFETKIDQENSPKKKSMKYWGRVARLKWMLGKGEAGVETFSQAKSRAMDAAKILDEAGSSNQKVMLTAHGFLNRYVKKDLEKMGWKEVTDTGNNYFGTTILVKIDK